MTDPRFDEAIRRAVECRRSIDSPDLARLAADDPAARAEWASQVGLDRAIGVWQVRRRAQARRRRFVVAAGATLAAAALFMPMAPRGTATAPTRTGVASVPIVTVPPVEKREPVVAPIPLLQERPDSRRVALLDSAPGAGGAEFAKAAVTAERLAYAFQPVGDGVGQVMRLVIDAVPGSESLML